MFMTARRADYNSKFESRNVSQQWSIIQMFLRVEASRTEISRNANSYKESFKLSEPNCALAKMASDFI